MGIPKIMMTAAKPTMLSDMEASSILQLRVCCRIKLRGDWEGSSDILREKNLRASREDAQRRDYRPDRSEEHTSELQSPYDLVCRLLLEKKKKQIQKCHRHSTHGEQ